MKNANLILRLPASIASRLRKAWFRLLGVRFTGRADLRRISIPRNPWDIAIGSAALDDGVVLITTGERRAEPRIVIGDGVYINRYTVIDASERVEIEGGVMIGPHCYITDHDHGTSGCGSVGSLALVSSPTRIGRNAWLGAHVVVLKGVTVGEGAVVGAGAVVTKDVPAGAIVAGVPAKVIGWRKQEAASNA